MVIFSLPEHKFRRSKKYNMNLLVLYKVLKYYHHVRYMYHHVTCQNCLQLSFIFFVFGAQDDTP